MQRRDIESNKTQMQQIIEKNFPICNLQGLFTENDKYLAGFEAIDMEGSSPDEFDSILSMSDINLRVSFCRQLAADCRFYLLLHSTYQSKNCIFIKEFVHNPDGNAVEIDCQRFNEEQFLIWWKSYSSFKQTKSYRHDAQEFLKNSYFDRLLAKEGLSWTFNIDGFLFDPKNGNKVKALIENRNSTERAVQFYDPSFFFRYDVKVWTALKKVSDRLGVPLILCTYSRKHDCKDQMGAAVIEGITEGLSYKDNIPPDRNIMNDHVSFKAWLNNVI